jgi:hypothetical protein
MPPAVQVRRAFAFLPGEQLTDAKTDLGRDLFGALEIAPRHLFKGNAVEFDQPLIALHVPTLVDGHGKVSAAEQLFRRGGAGR